MISAVWIDGHYLAPFWKVFWVACFPFMVFCSCSFLFDYLFSSVFVLLFGLFTFPCLVFLSHGRYLSVCVSCSEVNCLDLLFCYFLLPFSLSFVSCFSNIAINTFDQHVVKTRDFILRQWKFMNKASQVHKKVCKLIMSHC